MRLISTQNIQAPIEIAQDVPGPTPGSLPLLRSGAVLSVGQARLLVGKGIHSVWVADELSEGIEPSIPLPPDVRDRAAVAQGDYMRAATTAFATNKIDPKVILGVREMIAEIVDWLADFRPIATAFSDLTSADAFLHGHALRVTTLGILLHAQYVGEFGWIDAYDRLSRNLPSERVQMLGLGLLVHDVGKASMESAVIAKPEQKLTLEERFRMAQHPLLGAELMKGTMDPRIMSVVRCHHENFDGSGYPQAPQHIGQGIHVFARVAAVANAYDHATAAKPGQEHGRPAWHGIKVIRDGMGTKFDPDMVKAFCQLVMPYPIGSSVSLPDGREGVVSASGDGNPNLPLIRFREGAEIVERRLLFNEGVVVAGLDVGTAELLARLSGRN